MLTLNQQGADIYVAGKVFNACPEWTNWTPDLGPFACNAQISAVEDWLNSLNQNCDAPPKSVLVGHSLGGDGAIKVNYPKICSRILFDAFDPSLTINVGGYEVLVVQQQLAPPREPPSDGKVIHYLAQWPNLIPNLWGRRFYERENVTQQIVPGTNHSSVVTEVYNQSPFESSVFAREIFECRDRNF